MARIRVFSEIGFGLTIGALVAIGLFIIVGRLTIVALNHIGVWPLPF